MTLERLSPELRTRAAAIGGQQPYITADGLLVLIKLPAHMYNDLWVPPNLHGWQLLLARLVSLLGYLPPHPDRLQEGAKLGYNKQTCDGLRKAQDILKLCAELSVEAQIEEVEFLRLGGLVGRGIIFPIYGVVVELPASST